MDKKRIEDAQNTIEDAQDEDTSTEVTAPVVAPAEEDQGEAEPAPPSPLVGTTSEPDVPTPVTPEPDPGMPAELVDVPEESAPDAEAVVEEASAGEDASPVVLEQDAVEDQQPAELPQDTLPEAFPIQLLDDSVEVTQAEIPDGEETSIVPKGLPFDFGEIMDRLNRTVELPPTSIVEDAGTAIQLPPVPELVMTTEHAESALSQMGNHLRSLERRRL